MTTPIEPLSKATIDSFEKCINETGKGLSVVACESLIARARDYARLSVETARLEAMYTSAVSSWRTAYAECEQLRAEVERLGEPALLAANMCLSREFDDLMADHKKLRAEVREWLCEWCNIVYPGPPQPGASGLSSVVCPRCELSTAPRVSVEMRQLRTKVKRLRDENERLRDEHVSANSLLHEYAGSDSELLLQRLEPLIRGWAYLAASKREHVYASLHNFDEHGIETITTREASTLAAALRALVDENNGQ